MSSNSLKDEGVSAVCKANQSNKETKLVSLNFKKNGIGSTGANAVAAMVAVTGAVSSDCRSESSCTRWAEPVVAKTARQGSMFMFSRCWYARLFEISANLLNCRQRAIDAKHLGHMLGTC